MRGIVGLEVGIAENSNCRHERTLADGLTGLDEIAIGEVVLGGCLYVKPCCYAVGQVRS